MRCAAVSLPAERLCGHDCGAVSSESQRRTGHGSMLSRWRFPNTTIHSSCIPGHDKQISGMQSHGSHPISSSLTARPSWLDANPAHARERVGQHEAVPLQEFPRSGGTGLARTRFRHTGHAAAVSHWWAPCWRERGSRRQHTSIRTARDASHRQSARLPPARHALPRHGPFS